MRGIELERPGERETRGMALRDGSRTRPCVKLLVALDVRVGCEPRSYVLRPDCATSRERVARSALARDSRWREYDERSLARLCTASLLPDSRPARNCSPGVLLTAASSRVARWICSFAARLVLRGSRAEGRYTSRVFRSVLPCRELRYVSLTTYLSTRLLT
jgi:hypothetical protein